VLWLHIALALVALPLIASAVGRGRSLLRGAFAAGLLLLLAAWGWSRIHPDPNSRIVNPTSPPLSMDQEGAGASSPFAPASAQTNTGRIIPSNFFMDSKDCGRCHDHAVFFNGRFDRPIKEQIDTPEAQAGLGCMSCHAIVHVGSTMGNNDF